QTGKVEVEGYEAPVGDLQIEVESARYELAGRSLTINATLTNKSDQVYSVGEFLTANIRFLNPSVKHNNVNPGEEMVAAQGLTVTNKGIVAPGESLEVEMVASDALWEQYRMTGLINDPDSRFAGLLFYFDQDGKRYYQEIGGPILPKFF
ncbi:MAG TPA: methane monooxygenase/ammonia monooxygenase subunit B, partial [Gammaproteobacteria bacterium]|nr:methane monooxygenase/ammonia monooxygenase subunit B [Gammaproteobacteria bacterium]